MEEALKIALGEEFTKALVDAGLQREIPVSDERVIAWLRTLGFVPKDRFVGEGRFWFEQTEAPLAFVSWDRNGIRAVVTEVDFVNVAGDRAVVACYEVRGFGGNSLTIDAVSKELTPPPMLIKLSNVFNKK